MSEWITGNVPEETAQRVRSAVLGKIRRRRAARRTSLALAVAAVLAFLFWPSPPPVETLAYTPPPPPPAPVWTVVRPNPAAAPRKPERTLMANAAPQPAGRITIFTDDPNVVIVLVADGGDE